MTYPKNNHYEQRRLCLDALAVELVHDVAAQLNSARDINALARTNCRFYDILNPHLYNLHVQQHQGRDILVWAAKNGQGGTAQISLHAGANPNCTDPEFGLSALSWAAVKGHEEVVSVLLAADGIDPDPRNKRNRSPLSHAAENGHAGVVRLLLANGGVDVNSQDTADMPSKCYGLTPLLWAIAQPISWRKEEEEEEDGTSKYLNPWLFRRMCKTSILLHQKGYRWKGRTTNRLTEEKRKRYESRWVPGSPYEAIAHLLLDYGPNLVTDKSTRAIVVAAAHGSRRVVELLLEKGANIELTSNMSATIFAAASNGHVEVVEFLLERCADLNTMESTWHLQAAVRMAALNGHAEVVQMLLNRVVFRQERLFDPTRTWAPLVEAARRGHETTCGILVRYHKQNWPDSTLGDEALFWAAYSGSELTFRLLVDAEGPIVRDARERSGITMLSGAVMGRNHAIVKLLLEKGGVDINAQDQHGWTALTWAVRIKDQVMVDLLLDHGADPKFREAAKSTNEHPPHRVSDGEVSGNTRCLDPSYPVSFS